MRWLISRLLWCVLVLALTRPGAVSFAQNATNTAVTYATFLGGGSPDNFGETGWAAALGADGYVYVTGITTSPDDFPFTQRLFTNNPAWEGAFIGKFDPTNKEFVYLTFVPFCNAVAVTADAGGNAYFCGNADNQMTATNAWQSSYGGSDNDAFLAKLSPDGSQMLYATFLGGSSNDLARAIALDASGNVIVVGSTESPDFPTTSSVVGPQAPEGWKGFVAKFSAAGQLLASTYLGGSGQDYAFATGLDGAGNIYVAGQASSTHFQNAPAPVFLGTNGTTCGFVAKLSPDLAAVNYLTFLGGRGQTLVGAIAVNASGQVFLFGQTSCTNFPVTAGAPQSAYAGGQQDDFVAALSPDGANLVYATYLGGIYLEDLTTGYYIDNGYTFFPAAGAVLDKAGNFYVAGQTRSPAIAPDSLSANLHTGDSAGYVAKYDPSGNLLYLRYVGNSSSGTANGLAIDGHGDLFVTGETDLARLPPYFATAPGAPEPAYGGAPSDGYFTELTEGANISADDNFANRQELQGARVTVQANNSAATAEDGEPAHAGFAPARSLWWSWTAPANGKLDVSTAGSGFDTVLGVYTGATLATLQNVASNDDAGPGLTTSESRFPVTAGTTYQIAVDGKNASGSIMLTLTFSAPTNDDFANRAILNGFPASTTGSNVEATLEPEELIAYYGFRDDRSVWWSWTSPVSGDVAISSAGSDFDTELLVFTGNALTNLALVAVNDNETNDVLSSRVTIEAQAGATYQISVRGMDNASGHVRLSLGPATPPANDDFTNATPLTGTYVTATNYNFDATTEPGEPLLGNGDNAGKTLWWNWTAPTNGWVRIDTDGSDFDTRLGVFTGSALADLKRVAYNDDEAIGHPQSRVIFPVTAGALYHIDVDGSAQDPDGTIILTVFFYRPPFIAGSGVGGGAGAPFHFHVTGVAGLSYIVQISTNLATWTNAPGSAQMDSGSGFDFSDSITNAPTRFYRVEQGP